MKKVLCNARVWQYFRGFHTVGATFITQLNSINVGMCQGYSAVLLPQLLHVSGAHAGNVNRAMRINVEEASWIASLGVVLNPLGALLSGVLMDLCGRKMTICYTTVPFIFGWTLIGLSNDLYTLCIGRCISGLAIGMSSCCYVYVAEISTPSSRGFFSAIGPVFVSLGVLLVYTLGYVTDWKTIAFVGASVAMLTLAATFILPESPSWLATNGSLNEATNALTWFRGDHQSATVDAELADILETVKISRNSKPRSAKEMFFYCKRGAVCRPLIILTIFFALQELSGIYIILYYAIDFFHKVGAFYDDYLASIMVGLLRFVASIFGAICIQQFGRRTMATTSALLMTVAMAFGASYQHLFVYREETPQNTRPFLWIPLVSVLLNVSASMLGMLQLPWLMIGELFPLAVRGIMGGIVSSLAYLFIFLTVKFYPLLVDTLNVDGAMSLFAVASLFAAAFALLYLPETKDKSLFEIERIFAKSESGESKENLPGSIITAHRVPTVSAMVECGPRQELRV